MKLNILKTTDTVTRCDTEQCGSLCCLWQLCSKGLAVLACQACSFWSPLCWCKKKWFGVIAVPWGGLIFLVKSKPAACLIYSLFFPLSLSPSSAFSFFSLPCSHHWVNAYYNKLCVKLLNSVLGVQGIIHFAADWRDPASWGADMLTADALFSNPGVLHEYCVLF